MEAITYEKYLKTKQNVYLDAMNMVDLHTIMFNEKTQILCHKSITPSEDYYFDGHNESFAVIWNDGKAMPIMVYDCTWKDVIDVFL